MKKEKTTICYGRLLAKLLKEGKKDGWVLGKIKTH